MIDNINQWARSSVMLKVVTIGVLMLLLMIPSAMIRSLVREREVRRNEAVQEIGSKWGSHQSLTGPLIVVPYANHWKDERGIVQTGIAHAYFLPDTLKIEGPLTTEIRYRGIYETILYNGVFTISGEFTRLSIAGLTVSETQLYWDKAFVSLGITDLKGIRETPELTWNNQSLVLNPGVVARDVFESGIGAPVPISPDARGKISFRIKLSLNGSGGVQVTPVGKTTDVHLTSEWGHPSFQGSFLPETRSVNEKGFDATWKVLHLNRSYPQKWLGVEQNIQGSQFGVDLHQPADHYQKIDRSTKYAILFVFLSFLVFFFIEVLNKKRFHPIQYLLVGCAIILFYLMLLSLSEHLTFILAYLLASAGVVGLLTGYAHGVLQSKKIAYLVGGFISALYCFLYTLLQLEDYSLLLGSFLLFGTLAAVMYLTRKLDWYTT